MTTPHAPAQRGSAAAPAVVTTAEVRAHDRTVRYRRSGSTGPALLLLATDSPRDLWPELPELLSELFRLVIPELGVADTNPVASLRGMLAGLGFDAVPVIAAGRYCDAALGLALDGNENVGRVIVDAQRKGIMKVGFITLPGAQGQPVQ